MNNVNNLAVSDVTAKILKNFSAISDHIILNPGTTQRTVLQSMSVLAVAELPEAWPQETAIYRLGLFVSILSQFDKPVVQFAPDAMIVHQEVGTRLRIKHRYSDATTIAATPNKTLPTANPAAEILVSSYTMGVVKKTAALLNLTHFHITVSSKGVQFTANDPKIPNSHEFGIDMLASDFTLNDPSFERTIRINVEHFGYLLDGDYTLSVKDWKYVYFENKSVPVTYFIAEDKQID